MLSIPQVTRQMKQLFEVDAPLLARQAGLREKKLTFVHLALLLVLGWWKHPESGPSALARFAGSLGVTLSKQAVDGRWSPALADWLLALLQRAVQYVVSADGSSLAWMDRFTAVWVEDGSSVSLPEALARLWQGCGGSRQKEGKATKTASSLKITLRLDLKGGGWQGPHLQDGRRHESSSVLSRQPMARGSLWLADLGYWSLMRMKSLMQQGVYFCLRLTLGTILWYEKQRTDAPALLAALPQGTQQAEWQVNVGEQQRVKGVRLLAQRVPEEVAEQRQQRIREYARKHSKAVNPQALELAHWSLLVTNLPESLASLDQAFALSKARWQIELVFKLWKQEALLDEWTSSQPWRILCEVYAKLLAMVVQHWMLLLACQDDPDASAMDVAEILRGEVSTLAHGFGKHLTLGKAIRLVVQSVRGGCSIEARRTRLSTLRLIQSAFDLPLS